ncbi:MAG: S8 family serine peptidase [Alphaproteobacteria bacterium]
MFAEETVFNVAKCIIGNSGVLGWKMLTKLDLIKERLLVVGKVKSCALLLALTTVSACTGGGSSNGSGSTSSSTYTAGSNLQVIQTVNADHAHNMGITGTGVTVAVIDTGLNSSLSEFSDVVSVHSKSVVTNTDDVTDQVGHGTGVTSVIAAARNNLGMTGIAYNANILAIKADDPVGSFTSDRLKMAIDYAILRNADIVNMSIAGSRAPSFGFIDSMSAGVDDGMLFVLAAGNRGFDNPEYPARYAGAFTGPGQVISVGSVDSNNVISSFSNKAGASKNHFLVAPGEGIAALATNGSVINQSGTSFAAPLVAGAAALLKENAPHLTGNEIATILLTTARDLGDAGIDDIYGHGLLDVENALTPYGAAYIPAGAAIDTGSFGTASNTNVIFDPAFSSALINSVALKSTMALDEFDRAYQVDLASKVSHHEMDSDLIEWMKISPVESTSFTSLSPVTSLEFGNAPEKWVDAGTVNSNGGFFALTSVVSDTTQVEASVGKPVSQHVGLAAMDKSVAKSIKQISARHALENPYMSFAGGDLGLSATRKFGKKLSLRATYGLTTGKSLSSDVTSLRSDTTQMVASVEADYQFSPKFRMSFNAGQMFERGSLLNSYSQGAFAFQGNNVTNFASMSAKYNLTKNVNLFASYSRGHTQGRAQSMGLVSSISNLKSEAFSVAMATSQTKLLNVFSNGFAGKLKGATDKLTFSVSQPLRIVSGKANLSVPTARDIDGNITVINEAVSLAPQGRQIDAELNYTLILNSENGVSNSVGIKAGITRHNKHDADADLVTNVGIKLHRTF